MITSFANSKIKAIRKLEQKKYRQKTGTFFIEGLRTVGEAVQMGADIEMLVTCPDLLISEFGLSLLQNPALSDIQKVDVSTEIYQKIAHKDGPQGLGAVVRQRWQNLPDLQPQSNDIWIALDAVADPGNLGTILRTADGVGCQGVILLGNTTDPYDPTAVKASMGAVFALNLIKSDWHPFREWQKAQGLRLVGTSDSAAEDYQAIEYQRPLVLLMGSERHGLNEAKTAACDQMARIPMEGRSDSLNLAVAAAIMLYEIYNQHRKRGFSDT